MRGVLIAFCIYLKTLRSKSQALNAKLFMIISKLEILTGNTIINCSNCT